MWFKKAEKRPFVQNKIQISGKFSPNMLRKVCKLFDVKTDKFQGLSSVAGFSDRLKSWWFDLSIQQPL